MAGDNEKQDEPGDPRVYFAAERTLLAWVRTGLAMMGFGFVVARFGFFLRELAAQRSELPLPRFGLSLWIGVTLVILGVAATITSAINYWRIVERLKKGETLRFSPMSLAMVAALLLSLLGILMAIYLLLGFGFLP